MLWYSLIDLIFLPVNLVLNLVFGLLLGLGGLF